MLIQKLTLLVTAIALSIPTVGCAFLAPPLPTNPPPAAGEKTAPGLPPVNKAKKAAGTAEDTSKQQEQDVNPPQ